MSLKSLRKKPFYFLSGENKIKQEIANINFLYYTNEYKTGGGGGGGVTRILKILKIYFQLSLLILNQLLFVYLLSLRIQ